MHRPTSYLHLVRHRVSSWQHLRSVSRRF